jgi:hypothetical protein
MSKTNMQRSKGFTPIIDGLVQEFGSTTALIFGIVWRFCQMEFGECTASQDTIAKRANMGRASVNRCLKRLVDTGYLDVVKSFGKPNIYQDTGKAGLMFSIEAYAEGEKPKSEENNDLYQINTPTCIKLIQPPVLKSYTKKVSKRDSQESAKIAEAAQDQSVESKTLSTAEECKDMARKFNEAFPYFDHTGLNVLDLTAYPEGVRPVIARVCQLWRLRPPSKGKRGGEFARWIEDARALSEACGELGLTVIEAIRADHKAYMQAHGGLPPFTVSGPGALVKTARGKAGEIRQGRAEQPKAADQDVSKGFFI